MSKTRRVIAVCLLAGGLAFAGVAPASATVMAPAPGGFLADNVSGLLSFGTGDLIQTTSGLMRDLIGAAAGGTLPVG